MSEKGAPLMFGVHTSISLKPAVTKAIHLNNKKYILFLGCINCPVGTEPVLGFEYKWWNTLPSNMETTILSGINFEYKGMAGIFMDIFLPKMLPCCLLLIMSLEPTWYIQWSVGLEMERPSIQISSFL